MKKLTIYTNSSQQCWIITRPEIERKIKLVYYMAYWKLELLNNTTPPLKQ